jgi:RNase H-like domain found in reverse transcriptase
MNFAIHAHSLVQLTKKDQEFIFCKLEQKAMHTMKHLVVNSPAIWAIDYSTNQEVILAMDSSWCTVGFILSQMGADNMCYPLCFGSISWNEREQKYSQATIELYGLFCVLRNVWLYIIGIHSLAVEVNVKYIKGMINNPDFQPNATINHWLAGILLFDFKL